MRKTATLVAVLALAVVGALFLANVAKADTTYTNSPAWNGTSYGADWGVNPSDTSTYGETIPGNGEDLKSFTFYLDVNPNIVFRAFVGTWDGTKIGTLLWQSGDMTTGGANGSFTPVTAVAPGGLTLQAGQQYVIGLTTVFSTQSGQPITPNDARWGLTSADSFAGGSPVYFNTGTPSDLTTKPWDGNPGVFAGKDFAFQAVLGQPVAPVVDNVNACADGDAYRGGDGSYGRFVTIAEAQFNSGSWTDLQGHTWKVSPSNFMKGVGATCDNPMNYGYVYSGYNVSGDGTIDEAAPQFNIYPYWIPASEAKQQ